MPNKFSCKIYNDSDVIWTIPIETIEDTLINGNKKSCGLLYLDIECAGTIEFTDTTCKLNSNNEKICDKTTNKINYKNGNKDSVLTPLAVVNFHTHPLSCYIEAETVWGWPSGEDLAQCINFANSNNLTHIVFAIEGTYIMDFNKKLLNYLRTNKKLLNIVTKNVEEIFKKTHKHRMIINDSNPKIKLEDEFYHLFLKPLELQKQSNILFSWLHLVNSMSLKDLITLSKEFSKYFKEIKNMSSIDIETSYMNMKLFNIQFIKNNTIQWNNGISKQQIFDEFINKCDTLYIGLPKTINYKASFISESCKL
tara:strand:- start:76 stop:1002 length:927 start_codon:yes stop_codon:yes gene_type:complete